MELEHLFERVEKIKMPVRIMIFAVTLALLGSVFIWVIYLPKTDEISRLDKDIERLSQRLNQAKIKAKNLEKFEKDYSEVDLQFQEALKLLPNRKEIPSLLKNVTQLGTDSQLEFRLFNPQNERPRDFIMEIPVSIEVSGTYHNVALFFDRVGRMERIVNILNVSMQPVAPRSTTLITKCDAVTYRFKGGSNGDATQEKKQK
jgi:type IV pilus assembly protein PilO